MHTSASPVGKLGLMNAQWHFTAARPGDRARESQVEKFFHSDAVANRAEAIVREGIQNSLDAAAGRDHAHVRIVLGEWSAGEIAARWNRYGGGLLEHLKAAGGVGQLAERSQTTRSFRYLSFEDFGTTGLTGDPAQWWPDENKPNPFFNYFRAEGISDKSANQRGRHGVGRLVFMFASRIRCMFGLTQRADGNGTNALLMGTSVLRSHRIGGTPYRADGWFGVPDLQHPDLILPVTDGATVSAFTHDFGLTRRTQPGLSIVVPWADPEITHAALVAAVLTGYFHPILRNRLSVEVESGKGKLDVITAQTISRIIAAQPEALRSRAQALVNLGQAALQCKTPILLKSPSPTGAQKWTDGSIPKPAQEAIHARLEQGEVVSLTVPVWVRARRALAPQESSFELHMQRTATTADDCILFIRDGIVISDVRPRRASGIRALVVIDTGPLASFLGDAENPSHTEWQKDTVKESYIHAPGLLKYVTDSVAEVLRIVSAQQKQPDSSLLIDLFAMPSDSGTPRLKPRAGAKPGKQTAPPPLPPPPRPKRYHISRRGDGFVVQRGDPGAASPHELLIRAAYGVRRGSPFTKYDPADFRLDSPTITCALQGCTEISRKENRLHVRIDSPAFEIVVNGFDTAHRDLYVDVRPTGDPEPADTDSTTDEEDVSDAA